MQIDGYDRIQHLGYQAKAKFNAKLLDNYMVALVLKVNSAMAFRSIVQ